MPMMPPQQTVTPARRTRAIVSQPVVVGARRDDLAVELRRRVQVVVVRGQARVGQRVGLLVGQHAERAAGLHAERADAAHHLEHALELVAGLPHRATPRPCRSASRRRPCAPRPRRAPRRRSTSAVRARRRSCSAPTAGSRRSPPGSRRVLTFSSTQPCTSFGAWCARCTTCARMTRSMSGALYMPPISSMDQS